MPETPLHTKVIALVGIVVGLGAVILGIMTLTQTMQSLGTHATKIINSHDQ